MAPVMSSQLVKPRAFLTVALALSCGLLAAPAGGRPAAQLADIGPGPGSVVMHPHGYLAKVRITPNSSRRWNDIELVVSRRGTPLRRAAVSVRFDMPSMSMGAPRFRLKEARGGLYRYSGPAISMDGLWVLTFQVRPAHGAGFSVVVRDHVVR
jgi:YtkA-like protein